MVPGADLGVTSMLGGCHSVVQGDYVVLRVELKCTPHTASTLTLYYLSAPFMVSFYFIEGGVGATGHYAQRLLMTLYSGVNPGCS